MKLSTVFELLLIFLIIAFAASKHVDPKDETKLLLEKVIDKDQRNKRQIGDWSCSTSNLTSDCCRDFSLPVASVSGPDLLTMCILKNLQKDSLRVTMSSGEKTIRNITIQSKNPNPICVDLKGKISEFCGKIYGISKDGDQTRACLGLAIRSQGVRAGLPVNCFRFGHKSAKVERVDPSIPIPNDEDEEYDDDDDDDDDDDEDDNDNEKDDDDDDDFDLPVDDDDDDDDDDNDEEDDDIFGLEDDDENESENTVDSGDADYTGFSALGDEFLDSFFGSDKPKKKKKKNVNKVPINNKPQQVVTTAAPTKKIEPNKLVTTKVVLSTPLKPIETKKPATTQNLSSDKVYISRPSDKLYITSSEKYSTTPNKIITPNPEKLASTLDKVYISPSQYKPTERVRPETIKQSLESYIPTIPQISTEKVYTSPQQSSTDRVYVNSLSQQHTTENNYISTMDDKEHTIISNYYVPTTQQFGSTEKVYIPVNLSTPDGDFEPVTSTSVSVNVMQGNGTKTTNSSNNMVQVSTSENFGIEATTDNENNEIDSDIKTTIGDRFIEVNTISSSTPSKVNHLTTKSPANKDNGDELDVNTTTNVFDAEFETNSVKNDTSADEFDLDDDLEDSDEDLDESNSSNIVVNNESSNNNDYSNDDDEDDEFRNFDIHSKQSIIVSSSVPPLKSGRTHKRMNFQPSFNQKSLSASFFSSGGHLYKLRMSPVQEPESNLHRLGKLNSFVPSSHSLPNPWSILNAFPAHNVPSSNSQLHRFGLEREQEHRSSRNHKRMRLPPIESSDSVNSQ